MGLILSIFAFFNKVLHPENPEMYVSVSANAMVDTVKTVIPYAGKVPNNLGPKTEEYVKKAELLYTSDYLREQWLKSVSTLDDTPSGWVLKPKDPLNPIKPKWGLTSRGNVLLTT